MVDKTERNYKYPLKLEKKFNLIQNHTYLLEGKFCFFKKNRSYGFLKKRFNWFSTSTNTSSPRTRLYNNAPLTLDNIITANN